VAVGSPRALPTLPSWLTLGGTVVTPAQMQQLNTYMQFFSSPPMFRMFQATGQSISNNTTTQVTCDTLDYDTDFGRGSSSPWSFTIPTGLGGRWTFKWAVAYPINSTGSRAGFLYKNGSRVNGGTDEIAADNDFIETTGEMTIACAAGDVMSLWTWQNSGGALTLATGGTQSQFEGRLVSLASP
jgi:hypothetical protein